MDRRRAAEADFCPEDSKYLKKDGDAFVTTLGRKLSGMDKRVEQRTLVAGGEIEKVDTSDSGEDELGRLDIDLDRKSKQHNLTSSNVRAILHEVITHERVVAMMKATISDTQDLPLFEPKMTRSRLKQAVQQGQSLKWSLPEVSTATVKPPQFVDIDLEEDEDLSDEEYCPDDDDDNDDEEDDDNMAEENILGEQMMSSGCVPLHFLSAPDSFLERLNAVEEELDCNPTYNYNQGLDRKPDDDGGGVDDQGSGCLAYRTRSKLRLVNVPLGQLEAELQAPDITADMYEQCVGEDHHWTMWLQGLMAPDNEDEGEDDDDPEYNFLDDLDEPDLEDYRTDRAVQITKREVNELLDELFVTLEEEEDDEEQEEEAPSQTGPKFNIPQALRFEAPLATMLTERRQTVRKQYEALQQRRAMYDTTSHDHNNIPLMDESHLQPNSITPMILLQNQVCPTFHLSYVQKLQLQQQIQQHVQLLIQVHLLCRRVETLIHEASITKHYLLELQQFAHHQEKVFLPSTFRVCNLQGALDLLQEVEQRGEPPPAPPGPPLPRRWLPRMTPATNSHAFPLLPADTAWLFATRPIFLYPELLPVCSLEHRRHRRSVYTAGENGLIVLGLKHFDGTLQSDQLITSYLLCKTQWSFRKHIRDMSGPRAPNKSVIKTFLTQRVVPPLPLACSRVQPEGQCPPVDRDISSMPIWLKNSHLIIQKTRLNSSCYPPFLPPGITLRLHPHRINKPYPKPLPHRRLFTLAHNASLLPLAKAPAERQMDSQLSVSPVGVPINSICADNTQSSLYFVQRKQQSVSRQKDNCLVLPLPQSNLTKSESTNPTKPGFFLIQMRWTPLALPTDSPKHLPGQEILVVLDKRRDELSPQEEDKLEEEEGSSTPSTLSPLSSCTGEKEEEPGECTWTMSGVVSLNGGENSDGKEIEGREDGGSGEGGEEEIAGEGGGEGDPGGEGEEEQRDDGGGERKEDEEKDKDEDHDRQVEEEEEDFDDLTQDEDEEEVMSSASEESVLSVPELQETMKQLTWLAAERRLCTDGDSEEDHSPISPGSQEDEEEEEDEGPKGEESRRRRCNKEGRDEDMPSGEGTVRGGGRCPGRGRGRSRPLRGLRRSRQDRHSKDSAKLLQLYDENILENDPHRESKDMAFAQSYLNRVREALQNVPGQVEDFVSLLNEFEQVGDGEEVMLLFRKLRCILGDRTDLLRDFAAFLHPEQALQCGLFEEQQAFDRSRRFLRQLEISFGDNPSHYQKIIKALQTGPDLSPTSIHELKAQMATLLKGHTHLQAEFWVFFEELRPPPARPGQFEEARWPEDGGGGSDGVEGVGQIPVGGGTSGFEEVTLPELEEEEEGHKIQPMSSRRQRRKMDTHRSYKIKTICCFQDCDWSNKDWPCLCRDSKIRRHRRKGCPRCHGNKSSGGISQAMKSLYSRFSSAHDEPDDKDLDLKEDSPQSDQRPISWEVSFPLTDEDEEDDEDQSLSVKRSRKEEASATSNASSTPSSTSFTSSNPSVTSITSSIPSLTSSSSVSSVTSSTSSLPSVTSSTSSIPSVRPIISSVSSVTSSVSSVTCITSFNNSVTSVTSSVPSITSSSPSATSSNYPIHSFTSPFPAVTSITSTTSSPCVCTTSVTFATSPIIFSSSVTSFSSGPPCPSPPELPVCAKNISLTASGEKVILWTREADRVILTTCQQEGANQDTFQSISNLLGNKTPSEVSRRFRDLMRLFRTAARQTGSEDEAPPPEPAPTNEEGRGS